MSGSNTLRRRLLCEKSTVSLSSLIDIARSMESANFQAANIENASSQENSEFAHQLTTPTLSEEEQPNCTSDKRQQCTHCGNQPEHQPRNPPLQRTPSTTQHMRPLVLEKTVPLKPTDVKLRPYGEDNPAPIPFVGSFLGLINTPSGQTDLKKFLVLKAGNAVVF